MKLKFECNEICEAVNNFKPIFNSLSDFYCN